jgi:NDP-sugar pyrophosphorylase family protein
VLRPNQKLERFSEVKVSEDGRIAEFAGFPAPSAHNSAVDHQQGPLMFTGIHILEPEILDYIPRGVFSDFVRDIYPKAMGEGRMVAAHLSESPWYELSTLDRYLAISLEFLQREGRQLILDQGCRIEEGALVERSVLWKGVRVERGAKLFECIVGDNVVIPAGADFNRAAIVRADAAGASEKPGKALPAELIGENLVVHFG